MSRLFAYLLLSIAFSPALMAQTHRFEVQGDHFVLNGKPFVVRSGEMHYTRIPREYWRARLRMAQAMGLNTVAAYVFWNVHEATPGHYDFSGDKDLAAFIRIAQEEHLYVILRAGPYSCAEWEFGGFPAWLLKDPRMATALRSKDPAFMVPATRWLKRLGQELAPLQIDNGGPIIATQVENEYGNFSNDLEYMRQMREVFLQAGFDKSLLFTVDPSKALGKGEIDSLYAGVNFGTGRAKDALKILADKRPGQPLFATEYWPGWFDLWGHPHETRPLAPQLGDLEYMMSHGISFNLYMVHGGSSFGQTPGASESTGSYRGNVESYDYLAPIDEAGHATPKFYAYRDLILKYTHEQPLPAPATTPVITIPPFTITPTASLWQTLPPAITTDLPKTMEEIDQATGYLLYRKQLPKAVHGLLRFDHLYDYAIVYVDGKPLGTLDRHYHQDRIRIETNGPSRLDILVENTGRLNSTKFMRDERKGFRAAWLDDVPLTGWLEFALPMDSATKTKTSNVEGPHFSSGSFTLAQTGDTYLDVRALGKGLIWVNGHALGRFWNIGPQDTLYLPAPWLKKGINEVTLFELDDGHRIAELSGLQEAILDGPTPGYDTDPEKTKKKDAAGEFSSQMATPADAPRKQAP